MRLEPVAKRGPQHARGRARRAALHHEMLAVKEISGVSPVKRKGLKTWKGPEDSGGPFPSVAQQIVYAESALAFGKRIHRHGIPTVKVEIAELFIELSIGRLIAPRINSCFSVDSAVSSALPLRFGGKRLPCPASVGASFRLTHIHGPVQHVGDFVEPH